MARLPVLAAGVLLVCFVAAAVASPGPFLSDIMGFSGVSEKAKPASEYYSPNTEVASLQQTNFKGCRFTECFDDDECPANVVFQTDFTCNPKQQHYDHDDTIGQLGFSDKVGTCDWEISIYRWDDDYFGVEDNDPTPIFIDGGVALKFGTALGTCYLNSAAEQCDDPLCERMVISVQGGIYGTLAYTSTEGDSVFATPVETCNFDEPGSGFGRRTTKKVAAKKDGAAKKERKRVFRDTRFCTKRAVCPVNEGWCCDPENPAKEFLSLVLEITSEILLGGGGSIAPQRKAPAPTEAQVAYNKEASTPLFAGIAAIISGPFTVVSKHGTKIGDTGLFEFTLATADAEGPVTETTNNWPIVSAKKANIRFTRNHEGYYGREGSS